MRAPPSKRCCFEIRAESNRDFRIEIRLKPQKMKRNLFASFFVVLGMINRSVRANYREKQGNSRGGRERVGALLPFSVSKGQKNERRERAAIALKSLDNFRNDREASRAKETVTRKSDLTVGKRLITLRAKRFQRIFSNHSLHHRPL